MAGEEHRDAGRRAAAQQRGHDVDGDRVEAAERLVEHEQVGVVDERRGDLGALLVAQRQLLQLVVRARAEAELVEQLAGPPVRAPAAVRPCSRAKKTSWSSTLIFG